PRCPGHAPGLPGPPTVASHPGTADPRVTSSAPPRRRAIVNQASHDRGPSLPGDPAEGQPAPAGPPADAVRHEAPQTAAVPGWAWGLLVLVCAMHALDAADVWLMASALPSMTEDLGLDETDAGWLATALLVGAAVAGPMVGYLADRWRRPRLLAVGFTC